MLSWGRRALLPFGRIFSRTILNLTIEGKENLPPQGEPVMVIANHFGWFDAPILTLHLPFQLAFLVATESQRKWWVRTFNNLFDSIPIWRGQVDRTALRNAVGTLRAGRSLGVFPEGGINPELAERVARGEQITQTRGLMSRRDGKLARAKPGIAMLAVMSNVRILPVGLLGTEAILDNLKQRRRSNVTVRIGSLFGPLTIDEQLPGRERRKHLDLLADQMMTRVAELFPLEQRGPYQPIAPKTT
jgi:1-acyl-sn-glycerol-3-phosphate acyltransferase